MPTRSPDAADHLQQGLHHHAAGAAAAAVQCYRRVLADSPQDPDALHLLGVAALQAGDAAAGLGMIDAALAAAPGVGYYHANRARALEALGRAVEAAREWRRARRLVPADDALGEALAIGLFAPADGGTDPTPALTAYQAYVEAKRHSPYLDYPSHVQLETFATCNARCTFCPYTALARQGSRMPDELIAKAIDDLTTIPRDLPFQLSPFKVNEPFLDKRLFDIMGMIADKLPNARIALTTNGSPLTGRILDRLAAVKGLDALWVSFNDHRPEEYRAAMGLDFARTVERLDLLHRRVAENGLEARVVLSRVGDGSPADADFEAWVAERWPRFETSIVRRGDWIGQVDTAVAAVPDVGCARWFDLSITATGVVAHCCMDGNAEHPIGDLRTSHLLDIYNAPAFRALREKTASRRAVEPCRLCTFL